MSKLNPTTGERLVIIETKMDSIEKANLQQNETLGKIEAKLDSVILHKADKDEVIYLNKKMNKWIYGAVTGIIGLLATIVLLLIN